MSMYMEFLHVYTCPVPDSEVVSRMEGDLNQVSPGNGVHTHSVFLRISAQSVQLVGADEIVM